MRYFVILVNHIYEAEGDMLMPGFFITNHTSQSFIREMSQSNRIYEKMTLSNYFRWCDS